MVTTTTDRRETGTLIGSDKVEGTTVYGRDGNSVGEIQRVMIDKLSGKVAYAVMSFGRVLAAIGQTSRGNSWIGLRGTATAQAGTGTERTTARSTITTALRLIGTTDLSRPFKPAKARPTRRRAFALQRF
jgi:PRC-barrel domain